MTSSGRQSETDEDQTLSLPVLHRSQFLLPRNVSTASIREWVFSFVVIWVQKISFPSFIIVHTY